MRTNLRKSVAAFAAVGLFAVGCGNNDTPGVEPEEVNTDDAVTEETDFGTEEDLGTTEEDGMDDGVTEEDGFGDDVTEEDGMDDGMDDDVTEEDA